MLKTPRRTHLLHDDLKIKSFQKAHTLKVRASTPCCPGNQRGSQSFPGEISAIESHPGSSSAQSNWMHSVALRTLINQTKPVDSNIQSSVYTLHSHAQSSELREASSSSALELSVTQNHIFKEITIVLHSLKPIKLTQSEN